MLLLGLDVSPHVMPTLVTSSLQTFSLVMYGLNSSMLGVNACHQLV
jgi:hypothetical protein